MLRLVGILERIYCDLLRNCYLLKMTLSSGVNIETFINIDMIFCSSTIVLFCVWFCSKNLKCWTAYWK